MLAQFLFQRWVPKAERVRRYISLSYNINFVCRSCQLADGLRGVAKSSADAVLPLELRQVQGRNAWLAWG
jgi:hypothetical protein